MNITIANGKDDPLTFYIESCTLASDDFESESDCGEIQKLLNSYYKLANRNESDFQVSLSMDFENPDPQKVIFKIDVVAGDEVVETVLISDSNNSRFAVLNQIINKIRVAVKELYPDGNERKENDWLFTPRAGLYFSGGQTSETFNGSGGGSVVRVKSNSRFSAGAVGRYSSNSSDANAFSAEINSKETTYEFNMSYLRNVFSKNISFLVSGEYSRLDFKHSETDQLPEIALNNYATLKKVKFGVEWIKKPFLEESASNISVQLAVSPTEHYYLDSSNYEYTRGNFLYGAARLNFEKYLKNNNIIKLGLTAAKDLKGSKDTYVSLNFNPKFIIAKNLAMTPSVSVSYVNDQVLSPITGGGFISQTAATRGKYLGYFGSISFSYTLGNFAKNNMDRRWR